MLTEKIDWKDLEHGKHYYVVGSGIGVALDTGEAMEFDYYYGRIYDVSYFEFYSIPELKQLQEA